MRVLGDLCLGSSPNASNLTSDALPKVAALHVRIAKAVLVYEPMPSCVLPLGSIYARDDRHVVSKQVNPHVNVRGLGDTFVTEVGNIRISAICNPARAIDAYVVRRPHTGKNCLVHVDIDLTPVFLHF